MSWGPLILGHAPAKVVEAVAAAAREGTSFGAPTERETRLAEEIKDAFPSMDLVRLVSSGTEAVMSAVRVARAFTGRERIVKFDGGYHGHADALLVKAGSGATTFGVPSSAGVAAAAAAGTASLPYNDADRVADYLRKHTGEVAAVIVEPVAGNMGVVPPAPGFLEALRDLTEKHGALLIFDEVITGFRIARGGAQERFGLRADLTVLGKIIGGGLPVGAYGASKGIMAKVAPDGPVYQAGTLSGNPLAMRAGIATLAKLDTIDAYALLDKKAETLRALLAPLAKKYTGKILMLQMGSIFALYFTSQRAITTVDQVRACDMKAFGRFHGEMLARGVYLSPSGYEVGFLSTAHTDEDLARTARAMEEALGAVCR